MRFDFLEVRFKDASGRSLSDVIAKFYSDTQSDRKRRLWKRDEEDVYRLDSLVRHDNGCSGGFVKLNPNEVLQISKLDGEGLEEHDLPEGTAIGKDLAFRFYEATKTLVLERGQRQGTHWRLAEYLRNQAGCNSLVLLLLTEGGLNLQDLRRLTQVHIGFSALPSKKPVAKVVSVGGILDIPNQYGGASIQIKLSEVLGKGRRKIDADHVAETLQQINLCGYRLTTARAKGRVSENTEEVVLDLIRNRMVADVAVVSKYKKPLLKERLVAIEEAYGHFRSRLESRLQ